MSTRSAVGCSFHTLLLVLRLVLVLAGVAAIGIAAQGQSTGQVKPSPEQQQVPTPTFRTEANFVRVDVYPSADGRPIDDLRAEDFEVLEDGKPQKIETFEHIRIRPAGPQATRVEPNTVAEANQMAADPKARLFVLFLDTYHVEREGAHDVRQPLAHLLDRIIGQDDLVGVMTPEMSAGNVTFARRTGTIEDVLTRWWVWGRREFTSRDPIEDKYAACYPPESGRSSSVMAQEMIDRRREKMTLDAIEDLVRHLRGIREERKAIITISDGWTLFRPNEQLARPVGPGRRVPGPSGIFIGPGGKLQSGDKTDDDTLSVSECDHDRVMLAQLDNERQFRDLLDDANRSNASFYPIDPRGLPVFDSAVGPNPALMPAADGAQLSTRINTLQTLAGATDGIAIVNSNNIEGGIQRVIDDLTSYYLLGYYSTGKPDGRFHSITVRVKRPGVQVRARRGYRALTQEELATTRRTAVTAARPTPATVDAALPGLAAVRRDAVMYFRAGYAWQSSPGSDSSAAPPKPVVWVAGELNANRSLTKDWEQGATARISIIGQDGREVTSAGARLEAGTRSFLVRVAEGESLAPGEYTVRVDARAATGGLPATDAIRLSLPASPASRGLALGQALLFRRGPFTGPSFQAAADARFRRQERIRVQVPATGVPGDVTARLLGRNGQPIEVPVTASVESSAEGQSVVAELGLAPLAPGDYAVEINIGSGGQTQKVVTAFRIVP